MELSQASTGQTKAYVQQPGFFRSLNAIDWLFGAGLLAAALFALNRYAHHMDIYEQVILVLSAPTFALLGWHWKPVRWLIPLVAVLSLWAISLYGGAIDAANQKFFLKYMLSSQSAILWMSALFVFSTVFYWVGLAGRSNFGGSVGSKLCWAAVVLGWVGMMVRWFESYLMGPDVGHIPVSNLYEVFILFSLITAMFYLYYEGRYATRQLGPFVLLIIAAAVAFLLWYTVSRDAAQIQPLVPALQSWWMKIHVPANFIGYGTFALAAMVGTAYLLKSHGILADRLPSLEVLDDVMYKSISVGFAFFTVATILGALWAAEAWGGYWSWDPKETWALIVWLNYAAWLHMRLMSGLRGRVAAWWSVVGLLVTTFAFLGVNMFLSGLHSYGEL
ncbi:c-type cytochrome biogenesis protein CcsB [Massilia sp. IC2-477]|uniref:c-type cytochrome biogenesis protein CcsB n=1 Tax=unclassified Massilia TaxID=2609279 RepID=UPI001D104576|nr:MULTISPECIES: c-type cytochrome biogenesis protein CcsB [unclassified Massilia]MCC2957894.1 c-type cytochrome biogenesis protein CcsB [Massilia sp. IC2-477]MCC2974053.1 c-type cytochrome biogenesis protein CcsB [Massilia sp. IC2-476]